MNLTFAFEEDFSEFLDEYVFHFLPLLQQGSKNEALFPGKINGAKSAHLLGLQIMERVRKVTGLHISPHQFRHAAAARLLKEHPGEYETTRQLLGHRSIKTTTQFYCGLETIDASKRYGEMIRKYMPLK